MDEITAHYTLEGTADSVLQAMQGTPHTGATKSVILTIRVKYPNQRIWEYYKLPAIAPRNGNDALHAIQSLFNQRAITGAQFDDLEKIVDGFAKVK